MGKALVIKNADFSACAVTTITFDEEVPCTGVAFDSATVTLTELGTASIGYTLTPSNTTDTVTLTSSDTSVITVSGTTVTAVGIGTATLTLTCGSYSATCTVTVEVAETPLYMACIVGTTTDSSDNTGIFLGASNRRVVLAKSLSDTSYTTPIYQADNVDISYGNVGPIEIPENVTKIHVECSNLYGSGHYIYFFETTDNTFTSGSDTYTIVLSYATLSVSGSSLNTDVAVPEGATGYLVYCRPSVTYASAFSECTTATEVATVMEETFAPSVTYLTA